MRPELNHKWIACKASQSGHNGVSSVGLRVSGLGVARSRLSLGLIFLTVVQYPDEPAADGPLGV